MQIDLNIYFFDYWHGLGNCMVKKLLFDFGRARKGSGLGARGNSFCAFGGNGSNFGSGDFFAG